MYPHDASPLDQSFLQPKLDWHHPAVQHGYIAHNAPDILVPDIEKVGPGVANSLAEAYAAKPIVLGFTPGHGSNESIGPNREGDFFQLPPDNPEDANLGGWASHMGPLKFIGHRAMG